jgi:hypothetical protein
MLFLAATTLFTFILQTYMEKFKVFITHNVLYIEHIASDNQDDAYSALTHHIHS